jgi:putative peptide zinc metalloprotease protein
MNRSEPLLSPDWYRVAQLRPRLRSGVGVSRQQVRGETWFILSDPLSGRHHRFNEVAYGLIASCSGQSTLDEVWSARVVAEGDDAPSQAQVIQIFSQAFAANLFAGSQAADTAALMRAHQRTQGRRKRAALNPLAFQIPLWDPDAFLAQRLHWMRWVLQRPALWVLGLSIALGALLLLVHAASVAQFAARELGTGRMLLLMWLVYPVMKALHELAHAFMVKLYGGQVHEVGVSLLMLSPVPYVDASASVAFSNKHQRTAVAAAGIVVEAFLASMAMVLWLAFEPGLLQSLCFAVLFIGALSTLAINGNPLLKFDGYFVLCDWLELPNLAGRSSQYWQYLLKRHVLRLPQAHFGGMSRGERPWLLAYAPLSYAWRSVLLLGLVWWVNDWSPGLGLLLFAIASWLLLLKPLSAVLRWSLKSPELRRDRPRALGTVLASFAVLGVLGFGVPLPQRSHASAVVWLPDDAQLRTRSSGFIEEFLVADGTLVPAGTAVARLSNDLLQVELAKVQAALDQKTIERAARFEFDAKAAAAAQDEIDRLGADREQLRQKIDALIVRTRTAGRIVVDPRQSVVGKHLEQGELIAQVLPAGNPWVRTLVSNEDIALVRQQSGPVTVQLASSAHGQDPLPAQLISATPKSSVQLPTAALGEPAGGSIPTDPSDPSGKTARQPYFQLDLKLLASPSAQTGTTALTAPIGTRALVTFTHGQASLGQQLGRFLRKSFLRYFEQ